MRRFENSLEKIHRVGTSYTAAWLGELSLLFVLGTFSRIILCELILGFPLPA